VELIVVIVIVSILVGVALPRYFDHSSRAKESADVGAIAAISTALKLAYMSHRMTEAPAALWIDDVDDIPAIMSDGVLPDGITIAAGKLVDQRGNTYTLTAESAASAAMITLD
jgi:type II secretory pathway pseudopilin PulG